MSQSSTVPGGLLSKWASFAARRPKRVILGWIVALILVVGIATSLGGKFVDTFEIPGSESQQAVDLLQERFPSQAGDSAQMVFQSPSGINDPAVKAQIDAALAEAAALPEVIGVTSPFDANTISEDGTIAYATIQYDKPGNDVDEASFKALESLTERTESDQLTVEIGGQVVSAQELPETGTSELIGIGAAIIILLITFGSVIAMGLPIISALVGVIFGFLAAMIAAYFFDMSTISTAFISMIGLGVGIDYSLFIVTRFREGRHDGLSVHDSVVTAVNTAGRAVLFAGSIVIIALLGLFIVGIPFVGFMGLGGALVVFTSMLVANGLLPAILAWVGPHIDKWTIPTAKPTPVEKTFGYRLTTRIQRAPVLWLVGALAVVLTIASPMLSARVGSADAGNNPESMHTRRSYDLLAEGFGAGFNGPLLVVVNQEGGIDQTALDNLDQAMSGAANVVAVTQPTINADGDTAIVTVIPGTSPQDKGTEDLIANLRENVIPTALEGTTTHAYVGGGTAAFVDISEKIATGLPIYILIVAGLSIIVLMAVFRSVFIPIQAAVLNLLSFAAAYGVLVAVFQKGYGASLFGVDRTGPIESFLPLILFGILFGLSMDYEVFLVSRIRESYLESKNTNWALSHGIGKTSRVIIAAGAIMVAVFASFVLGDSRTIKEFGIGLASAIFVDVAIVRLILVPAIMTISGNANWWFPSWLDRILPRLDIEGGAADHPQGQPALQPVGAPTPLSVGADGD